MRILAPFAAVIVLASCTMGDSSYYHDAENALREGRVDEALELARLTIATGDSDVKWRAKSLVARVYRQRGADALRHGDPAGAKDAFAVAIDHGDLSARALWVQANEMAEKQAAERRTRWAEYQRQAAAEVARQQRERDFVELERHAIAALGRLAQVAPAVAGYLVERMILDTFSKPDGLFRRSLAVYDLIQFNGEATEFARQHGCTTVRNGITYWDVGCTLDAAVRR